MPCPSSLLLKLDKINVCTIIAVSRTVFKLYGIQTWHDGRHMRGIYAHARFDDLDLDELSQLVGKCKKDQR